MALNQIIIMDGRWMHIPQVRAYHRRYPELRGVGRSRAEALAHLANQLAGSLDCVPGRGTREAVERALADVRASGSRATRDPIAAPSK